MTSDGRENVLEVVGAKGEECRGNASAIFVSEMWFQAKTHM